MIHYPLCLYYIKQEDYDYFLDKSYLFEMLYNVLLEVREPNGDTCKLPWHNVT